MKTRSILLSGLISPLLFVFLVFLHFGMMGCGSTEPDTSPPETDELKGLVRVNGMARFGNQCPSFGTYAEPKPAPLVLENCPVSLDEIDLAAPLDPIIIQADCKKMLIDIRNDGQGHTARATVWEAMPDGNFYFMIDGGMARIKNDGNGNTDCAMPLTAEIWGKLDCQNRDQVKIRMETVWRATDATSTDISGSPSSSPLPSPIGGSPSPSASPIASSGSPGGPSGGPMIIPLPSISVGPIPAPTHTLIPASSGTATGPVPQPTHGHPLRATGPSTGNLPLCKLPKSCYFHNIVHINQCF